MLGAEVCGAGDEIPDVATGVDAGEGEVVAVEGSLASGEVLCNEFKSEAAGCTAVLRTSAMDALDRTNSLGLGRNMLLAVSSVLLGVGGEEMV